MKIFVPKITDLGLHVDLKMSDSWFQDVMAPYLADPLIQIQKDTIKGFFDVKNYKEEVDIRGELAFNYDCACAHCGEPLKDKIKLDWDMHLSPWRGTTTDNMSESEEDGLELTVEDLNFSFYKNDEIDLTPILNDEIALSFPYNHYCKNKTECDARFQEKIQAVAPKIADPRWDALKDFKVKN